MVEVGFKPTQGDSFLGLIYHQGLRPCSVTELFDLAGEWSTYESLFNPTLSATGTLPHR